MLEEALSLLSMLASMNSWLTPTVLFLLLNLIIFTILFTSHQPPPATNLHHHLHQQPPHDHLQPQLSRSLSVLQRLKSLNLYNYTPSPHTHAPPPQPPPTTTTETIPEPHVEPAAIEDDVEVDEGPTMEEVYNRIQQQQQLPKCVPLSLGVGRIPSKTNNSAQYGRQKSHTQPASGEPISEPYVAPPAAIVDEGPTMEEIYNQIQQQQTSKCVPLLLGVGKISSKMNNSAQYGRQNSDTEPVGFETDVEFPAIEGPTMEEIYSRIIHSKENNNSASHNGRQNSDTEPAGGEVPVRLPRKMKKSATDKSAFNHFEAVAEINEVALPPPVAEEREKSPAEEVDARADDFINKFKQQLKMQRMDSVQQYKEMIAKVSAN